jgi:hypothetical protein
MILPALEPGQQHGRTFSREYVAMSCIKSTVRAASLKKEATTNRDGQ